MNRPATLHDYGARVQRAIAHMAANLDRNLDLETLAGVACFSPYHFHRIYRELTGQTVAETLRRLRLNRAAAALVQGRAPLPTIARRCGYGSVAAFTRAFRAMYGLPPASYRQRGRLVPSTLTAPHLTEHGMYEVSFIDFPATRVAGIDHVGPFAEMGGSFDRLFAWARARGLDTPEARSFGIYYDDPESVPESQLRSVACLELLGADVVAEAPVRLLEIEAGPCARIVHRGAYAELEAAYTWLYRDWLPTSGLEPADRPCFEEYLNDPTTLPPSEWLTAIHLPLVALPAAQAA